MNVFARLWQFLVWFLLMTPLKCLVSGHTSESNIPFEPVNNTGDGDDSDAESDIDEHVFSGTEPFCACESQTSDSKVSSSEETCTCSQSIRNRNFSPSSSPASPTVFPPSAKSQMGESAHPKQSPRRSTELFVNISISIQRQLNSILIGSQFAFLFRRSFH